MYYTFYAKLKIIKKDDCIAFEFPFNIYSKKVICNGIDITYKKNKKDDLINNFVLARLTVKSENKEKVKQYSGYITDSDINILEWKEYENFYPFKNKDLKRIVDEKKNIIEYEGEDAERNALF